MLMAILAITWLQAKQYQKPSRLLAVQVGQKCYISLVIS